MQKKNRGGFTLIELLAVIVILAIIALIAVPVIMNVITKARVSAFEDSAYGIVKAGEMYYTNKLLDAEGMTKDEEFIVENDVFKNTENSDTLDLSGSIPKSGKVKVTTEGKVALAISNGEYCIRKATTESKVKAEKLSNLGGTCTYKTVFTTTTDEKAIPACITNNTTCSAEDIKNGLKVGVKVNDIKTYDFYVISEDAEKGTITLIDTDGYMESWSEDTYVWNATGPVTALKSLEKQTSSWTNIPLKTYTLIDDNNTPMYSPMTRTARARLLTMTEASELGCTTSSGSCPTWLYENVSYPDLPTQYLWTSTADASSKYDAWVIKYDGSLSTQVVNPAGGKDYRPVITVSKTIL